MRFKDAVNWFSSLKREEQYLPKLFPAVYNIFCVNSIVKLGQMQPNSDSVMIPPFLRAIDHNPSKKQLEANLLAFWPIFLHNAMVFGIIELTNELIDEISKLEQHIVESDNPWFYMLLESADKQIQPEQLMENMSQQDQLHLNVSRPIFESATESLRNAMLKHFNYSRIKQEYGPYL